MKKSIISILAAGAAVAMLAGCSQAADTSKDTSNDSGSAEFTTISEGVLTVGLSPDFPPMEYLDGDKLIGSDVELITEVAERMGLEVKFEQQKFDQLINSVRTERVDLVISGMSDTVERQKTLEMVDYYSSAGRFYVLPEEAGNFAKNEDLCGASVAVSSKTDYFPALQEFSAEVCEDAGLDAINIVATDSGAAARLQLDQGRAQAAVQGAENLAYFETTEPGKYEIILDPVNESPFGISVNKGNMALAEALQATLQEMYDDGTSQEIAAAHGLNGIIEPEINGVTE